MLILKDVQAKSESFSREYTPKIMCWSETKLIKKRVYTADVKGPKNKYMSQLMVWGTLK